jgi:hypothetical protein
MKKLKRTKLKTNRKEKKKQKKIKPNTLQDPHFQSQLSQYSGRSKQPKKYTPGYAFAEVVVGADTHCHISNSGGTYSRTVYPATMSSDAATISSARYVVHSSPPVQAGNNFQSMSPSEKLTEAETETDSLDDACFRVSGEVDGYAGADVKCVDLDQTTRSSSSSNSSNPVT